MPKQKFLVAIAVGIAVAAGMLGSRRAALGAKSEVVEQT